jgi:hypothetical protein
LWWICRLAEVILASRRARLTYHSGRFAKNPAPLLSNEDSESEKGRLRSKSKHYPISGMAVNVKSKKPDAVSTEIDMSLIENLYRNFCGLNPLPALLNLASLTLVNKAIY